MRILFFLSHPAQYLFHKNSISCLKQKGHEVFILIKTKDILKEMLDIEGLDYYNILPNERGKTKFHIIFSLLIRDIKLLLFSRKHKITMHIGTDACLAHVAKLRGIPCITTLEDDYSVIKNLARITYPFSTVIITPHVCDVDKWKEKKIGYAGYMKLAYLHPKWFVPDITKVKLDQSKPFFLIRLSGLKAHHDFGITGISDSLLEEIIKRVETCGNVYVSSERKLPAIFEKYILSIPITDIHHYLFYSNMLISDSQSMSVEAAMLGTPNIRVSSFSGRIRVLEELEHTYSLTFGIKPENEKQVLGKINELNGQQDLKEIYQERRRKMLADKIDVTAFMVWFIENYPESADIMKNNPDYQHNFR